MKNRCGGCKYWHGERNTDCGRCMHVQVINSVHDARLPGGTSEIGYRLTNRHFGCIFYAKQPVFRLYDGVGIEHIPTGKKLSIPGMLDSHGRVLCEWLSDLLDS